LRLLRARCGKSRPAKLPIRTQRRFERYCLDGWARIGLSAQQSDDDLRATVIRKAARHDTVLEAEQIAVKRSGTVEAPWWFWR
jgi:hypothetical protein